jgi:hypothetical protein
MCLTYLIRFNTEQEAVTPHTRAQIHGIMKGVRKREQRSRECLLQQLKHGAVSFNLRWQWTNWGNKKDWMPMVTDWFGRISLPEQTWVTFGRLDLASVYNSEWKFFCASNTLDYVLLYTNEWNWNRCPTLCNYSKHMIVHAVVSSKRESQRISKKKTLVLNGLKLRQQP